MINLDQVKSYNDKGYLVVENAIPQDKLKELQIEEFENIPLDHKN